MKFIVTIIYKGTAQESLYIIANNEDEAFGKLISHCESHNNIIGQYNDDGRFERNKDWNFIMTENIWMNYIF